MQETRDRWVRSLGWEDPLEKERATRSSILAREIPWTEEPGGLQSLGLQRAGHDSVCACAHIRAQCTHTHIHIQYLSSAHIKVLLILLLLKKTLLKKPLLGSEFVQIFLLGLVQ